MKLTKDEIWNLLNIESLEDFYNKFVSNIIIHQDSPEDIKAEIETIKKLILHSYYEYEFLDIALTHAVFTLEKALRIKWLEIHNSEQKKTLQLLIDWFFENGYFETYNKQPLHQLRDIRNGKVHETLKSLGGALFIRKIKDTTRFIYDLYEDIEKRKQRKSDLEDIIKQTDQLERAGCILEINSKRYIIFKIAPLFIHNKKAEEPLYISAIPIFDTEQIVNNNYPIQPIDISLINWKIENQSLKGIDNQTKLPVSISPMDDKNKDRYDEWLKQLKAIHDKNTLVAVLEHITSNSFTKSLEEYYTE
jgi:hypothetical protein